MGSESEAGAGLSKLQASDMYFELAQVVGAPLAVLNVAFREVESEADSRRGLKADAAIDMMLLSIKDISEKLDGFIERLAIAAGEQGRFKPFN